MQRLPITKKGAERLRRELQKLKEHDRPAVIEAIAKAREHGDLKENAEYHAAREQQSFIEGRIRNIEMHLSNCETIDVSRIQAGDKVVFGATVTLRDEGDKEERKWQIVGEPEADINAGMISVASPVAHALIGKFEGDEAVIQVPSGDEKTYTVVKVEYV